MSGWDTASAPLQAGIILIAPNKSQTDTQRQAETSGLVRALDVETQFIKCLRIRKPHPASLFSVGQVQDIADDMLGNRPDLLVIDASLTPVQQRNLEKRLSLKVLDRTGLILEIFGLRARSAEGRLQVEMARLVYERSRLVRTWTHLERQRGGLGFVAGPGESQLESDRRMLDRQIQRYRHRLEHVRRNRGEQSRGRKRRRVPVVALVGYTNAGKSSLFNSLCGANTQVADMPFATLDPTFREIALPSGRRCALIDTVGFITDLPTCLIAAFRATIEQVLDADLLLHIRDIAHPGSAAQNTDVRALLRQLEHDTGLTLPPLLEVWNKIDRVNDTAREALPAQAALAESVPISAQSGHGHEALLEAMDAALHPHRQKLSLVLPPEAGRFRAWLYQTTQILHEDYAENGHLHMQILATPEEFARIQARSRSNSWQADLQMDFAKDEGPV